MLCHFLQFCFYIDIYAPLLPLSSFLLASTPAMVESYLTGGCLHPPSTPLFPPPHRHPLHPSSSRLPLREVAAVATSPMPPLIVVCSPSHCTLRTRCLMGFTARRRAYCEVCPSPPPLPPREAPPRHHLSLRRPPPLLTTCSPGCWGRE